MKTIFSVMLCSVAFTAPDAPSPADSAGIRGKVLVLQNEQTLIGEIEKVGDVYRVRRLIGETTVTADRVLQLCGSLEEAYDFVRGRANLTDPDERLRVAEWCRLNGLHEQALTEVKAAVELRPDHPASRRLLTYLQESVPIQTAPTKPRPEAPETEAKVPLDLTEEALGQFATKIQPILMNTCANCHANGHGGAFKLTRSYEAALLNRKTLQQNLAAVLGEVNFGQPLNSPLLSKAVSVHGPLEQAPIKNRQAAAYRSLEDWVRSTVTENPQLRDQPTARPAAPTPFAEVRPTGFTDQTEPRKVQGDAAPVAPPLPVPAVKEPPEPVDPYSPDSFNHQFHADKSKPATPSKP
jgi:hypothetical protein